MKSNKKKEIIKKVVVKERPATLEELTEAVRFVTSSDKHSLDTEVFYLAIQAIKYRNDNS